MANFQYSSGNKFIEGTSFDDRIMLKQGIPGSNNGFIDGGGGFDVFYIQESISDWDLILNDVSDVSFLSSARSSHSGGGSQLPNGGWALDIQMTGVESIVFTDETIYLDTSNDLEFNEIMGTKKGDWLTGTNGADYLWGHKGDDELFGGGGDDLIVGGKGFDYIEGGKGGDHFGVSKKLGKGKKNWDFIADFEVGEDAIYIDGSSKGMWIDNNEGDAVLLRKNDVIAWIEGAGGQLDWSSDGSFIM